MIIEPNLNMDIQYERQIWNTLILDKLVEKPKSCNLYGYSNVSLVENNTINYPYICRCSNKKCRKVIYLKDHTIFNEFPRTGCSIILYIIKLLLFDNNNASEIKNKFNNEIPNLNFSLLHLSNILQKIQTIYFSIYKGYLCIRRYFRSY